MPDQPLTQRAQAALERNLHLPRGRFLIEAREGRLVLRGKVDSYFQKQMAQESLRALEGLHQLENLLEVHWNRREQEPV